MGAVSILHGFGDVQNLDFGFLACLGALFFNHQFNPRPRVIHSEKSVQESEEPEQPPTLSQILRFWTTSEGLQNQMIVLKNRIPLCTTMQLLPKTKKKCGYLKAFVCSKTCKVKLVT